jgi:cytochrome oxidase Cu insertion factor (SCO1/SenC/PrrC family)
MRTPYWRHLDIRRTPVVVLLLWLAVLPAQAGSDRPSLDTLIEEARISAPPKPFPAPSFSVADLAGGTVELDRLRGRVVLLYFWTTW